MEKDFSHIMSERTNKQLVDIVTIKQDEYQPEAVLAAINELEKRQVDVKNFYTSEQIANIETSELLEKETTPFLWQHKVLIVLLPMIIMLVTIFVGEKIFGYKFGGGLGFFLIYLAQLVTYRNLKSNGYLKRAAEFKRWIAYTLYIYLSLLTVITILVVLFY